MGLRQNDVPRMLWALEIENTTSCMRPDLSWRKSFALEFCVTRRAIRPVGWPSCASVKRLFDKQDRQSRDKLPGDEHQSGQGDGIFEARQQLLQRGIVTLYILSDMAF